MPPEGRCATVEVDLDRLAGAYRFRPASAAALARAQRVVDEGSVASGSWALDVGGGTGAHAGVWAAAGLRAVVVDPSRSMQAAVSARSGVCGVRGTAQALPFGDARFGLVYFHLSLHYGDWRRALDEGLRVLAPGARLWVWTLGPVHHGTSMLTRWFPRVGEIDALRFPDPSEVELYLAERRPRTAAGREVETVRRRAGEWIEAVEAGFVSTLQLLEPGEFDSGLVAFREAHPDPAEWIDYHLTFEWVTAW